MSTATGKPTKETNLGFRITAATEQKLVAVANQDGRSKSAMARHLLERALDAWNNGSAEGEQSANKQEQQAA